MATKAEKTLHLDTKQPETRKTVYEVIRALPEGQYTIDLSKIRWRVGDGQRGYYWGYLVVEVGKLIDKGREETDKVLNALFLSEPWEVAGQVVTVVRSLSDLDPAAAAQYFDEVAAWVFTTYGVRLTALDPSKAKVKQPLLK
ncbi:hypothetical protein [Spirosoma endophyticum]|uniref:Uncharacterized protein n=1 Tax=Spirosoma endophyticum TaxID=662367 RepID=A0A1I2GVG1_9BACT|nr:hypothetical protein [Spirosoma endophyticum]SFF21934.1 hypothetical protein SAMN05216167_13616 [Spirosoma endophyticum]